jgi:hypothetical protein
LCRFEKPSFGMATTEVPLRAESTVLEEPEKQQLLPKSYAEALEEGLPAYEGNGVDDTNGRNSTMNTKRTNGTAPVLRIVDTDGPVEKKEGRRENRAQLENNGANHAYVTDVGVPVRICSLAKSYFYRAKMAQSSSPETRPRMIARRMERYQEPSRLGPAG